MFAFAKQLVRSAEDIISHNAGLPPTNYNVSHRDGYANYRGSAAMLTAGGGGGGGGHDGIAGGVLGGGLGREDPKYGFRVLYVRPDSLAAAHGVEMLFDYVVGVGGVDVEDLVKQAKAQQRGRAIAAAAALQSVNEEEEEQGQEGGKEMPGSTPSTTTSGNRLETDVAAGIQHTLPPGNPKKRHKRGSLSFSSASGILLPQLLPPEPEVAPIDVFLDSIRRPSLTTGQTGSSSSSSVKLDLWSAKGRVRRSIVVKLSSSIEEGADVDGDRTNPNDIKDEEKKALFEQAQQSEQIEPTAATTQSAAFGLGLTLHWTPLFVADHVWHILDVSPNSPAEAAGLISHSDYIVAAENGLLEQGGEDLLGRVVQRLVMNHAQYRRNAEQELYQLHQQQLYQQQQQAINSRFPIQSPESVQLNDDDEKSGTPLSPPLPLESPTPPQPQPHAQPQAQPQLQPQLQLQPAPTIVDSVPELELFVYNHDYNVLRAIRIRPNSQWGGSGLLGCGVGYGLLHRLPATINNNSLKQPNQNQPDYSFGFNQGSSSGLNNRSGGLGEPPVSAITATGSPTLQKSSHMYQQQHRRHASSSVGSSRQRDLNAGRKNLHGRSFSSSFSVAAGSLPPGGLLFDLSMAHEEADDDDDDEEGHKQHEKKEHDAEEAAFGDDELDPKDSSVVKST